MIDLQVLSDILLWKSIDFISLKRSNLFLHYPKAYVFDYNDDHGSQSFLLTLASSGIRLGTPWPELRQYLKLPVSKTRAPPSILRSSRLVLGFRFWKSVQV